MPRKPSLVIKRTYAMPTDVVHVLAKLPSEERDAEIAATIAAAPRRMALLDKLPKPWRELVYKHGCLRQICNLYAEGVSLEKAARFLDRPAPDAVLIWTQVKELELSDLDL